MVRYLSNGKTKKVCFPRARGDGPPFPALKAQDLMFSPRPWGWSVMYLLQYMRINVFPAPVGMVRCNVSNFVEIERFPRARGDGPEFFNLNG